MVEEEEIMLHKKQEKNRGTLGELNAQIHERKEQFAASKAKERQKERELLEDSSATYNFARRQEKDKKNKYREDLLNQLQTSPDRIKKIADGLTGFIIDGGDKRRGMDGDQLKKELAEQMEQKKLTAQEKRQVNTELETFK